ncbi:nucleotide disphospho-sugar-binding domain-containing protein [Nonomuraea wenchangensis]|uniref:nucleotide disphospho-sugar-binding domain-containing protein n=1 Tax=Nonomuraea wenchangensis TaxID=568860 RepID=UPI0034150523
MVPLAWALRAAGHEVLVATQPELLETVRHTGLPAAAVGRDVDAPAAFHDIAFPSSAPPGEGARGGPRVVGLFAAIAEAMAPELVALGRGWRADLIVSEPTCLAGPVAAAALGVPHVRHLFGTDLLGNAAPFLHQALGPLCDRLGLPEVDLAGVATVDPWPSGLQVPAPSRRIPLRYVPFNGPGRLPRPLPGGGGSGLPRVCVTWGTTPARVDKRLFLAGRVARALAGRARVVLAVTAEQRSLLGELPPDAHVVESVPLHLLLPRCEAVVCHGGAGTVLTALAQGLPLLLIPCLPDHVRHSAAVAGAGAGVALPAGTGDPELIAAALPDVLACGAAADGLRAELAARPSPAAVARELETLVQLADR